MKTKALLITSILFVGCTARASSICGTVAELGGNPLQKAFITVTSVVQPDVHVSVPVDTKGRACADHLPEGLYAVEASSYTALYIKVRYYPVRVVFPEDVNLEFNLPFGEIREGSVSTEAILSGTLSHQGKPSDDVKICLFEIGNAVPAGCTATNDIGQYALIVRPGMYRLEVTAPGRDVQRSMIGLSAGYNRNLVSILPEAAESPRSLGGRPAHDVPRW